MNKVKVTVPKPGGKAVVKSKKKRQPTNVTTVKVAAGNVLVQTPNPIKKEERVVTIENAKNADELIGVVGEDKAIIIGMIKQIEPDYKIDGRTKITKAAEIYLQLRDEIDAAADELKETISLDEIE